MKAVCRHPIRFVIRLVRFTTLLLSAGWDAYQMKKGGNVSLTDRGRWLSRWSQRGLQSMKIEVVSTGTPPTQGLWISNHLSYLDVMVLASVSPTTFLSKVEVKSWPIVGWFVDFAGTLYIRRESKRELVRLQTAFTEVWDQGSLLTLFPEGTTTNGEECLPFHPSLLQPACQQGQSVTPVHLRYECRGGDVSEDVHFWRDMTFLPHLMRLLCVANIRAEVRMGIPRETRGQDRKKLAATLHQDVESLKQEATRNDAFRGL